jgi:hypothetical protein
MTENEDLSITMHVREVCHRAGLPIMEGVFDILRDRGEIAESSLAELTEDLVAEMYEAIIGPAVDELEECLRATRVA